MGIKTPIPPSDELAAILEAVRSYDEDITAAIPHTRREVELVGEYRTRLIADVVTGKLDVREAAATLPDIDPLAANDTLKDTMDLDA